MWLVINNYSKLSTGSNWTNHSGLQNVWYPSYSSSIPSAKSQYERSILGSNILVVLGFLSRLLEIIAIEFKISANWTILNSCCCRFWSIVIPYIWCTFHQANFKCILEYKMEVKYENWKMFEILYFTETWTDIILCQVGPGNRIRTQKRIFNFFKLFCHSDTISISSHGTSA